jgi:hypothetical protein
MTKGTAPTPVTSGPIGAKQHHRVPMIGVAFDQTLEFDVIVFSSGPCDVIADSSGSTKDTVVRQAKPGTVTPTGGQMPRHSAVVEIARPLAL